MTVTVTKNGVKFELALIDICDGVMQVESTSKTRAFGVPEYLRCTYASELHTTYKANGWSVSVWP